MALPPPFPQVHGASLPPHILTIGHSNHDAERFLTLLRQHGVTALVDVRSAPYIRYAPHFNRRALERLLAAAEIAYSWAGDRLGGRPDDPACYHDGIVHKGRIDYAAVAQRLWYREGVQCLLDLAVRETAAIMCSEEDPRRCHRHRLIEATLRDLGAEVLHIRRDGSLESIAPAAPPLAAPGPQLALTGMDG